MTAPLDAGALATRRRTLCVALTLTLFGGTRAATAQTFVQIQQLGSTVGPRMTRQWAVANVNGARVFFQERGGSGYLVDASGSRYRFATK